MDGLWADRLLRAKGKQRRFEEEQAVCNRQDKSLVANKVVVDGKKQKNEVVAYSEAQVLKSYMPKTLKRIKCRIARKELHKGMSDMSGPAS